MHINCYLLYELYRVFPFLFIKCNFCTRFCEKVHSIYINNAKIITIDFANLVELLLEVCNFMAYRIVSGLASFAISGRLLLSIFSIFIQEYI